MADFEEQRPVAGTDLLEQIAHDAAVCVQVVEPDSRGAMDVAERIATDEYALGGVELQSGDLPHSLDVQAADPLDEVVLDERLVNAGAAGDAADAAIADPVAADDVPAELRRPGRLPVLVSHVDPAGVCPANLVLLQNPVMAAVRAEQGVLGHGDPVGGAGKVKTADADIAQPAVSRGEDLLLDGDFHCRLPRIGVAGKPEVKAQARFFDPEGAILAGQIGVAEDLPRVVFR